MQGRSAHGPAGRVPRRALCALGLAAALTAAAPAVHAQEFVMKFATQTANDVQTEFMRAYKEQLEQDTHNRIRVDLYASAQLGAAPRQAEGLRLGTIEAGVGPGELFAGIDQRFQVLALSGLFRDVEHARRALVVPELHDAVRDLAASRNLVLIGINLFDLQEFSFTTPVTSLKGFPGKRLRVLASEGEQRAVSALGGSPVPMALPEVLAALQQRTIDGQTTGMPVYSAFRYYDTSPYLLDTHLWAIVSLSVVSKAFYNRLPSDLQKAVVEAGAKVEPEVTKWSLARNEADRKNWIEHGGKIATLSPEEQEDAVRRSTESVEALLNKNAALKEFYEKIRAAARTAL